MPIVPTDAAQRRMSSTTLALRKSRHPNFAPRDAFAYTGAFMGNPAEQNFCSSCTDHHWTTARATWSHSRVGRSGTAILTT